MAFVAKPLFPGDAFDTAVKFAKLADRRLAPLVDATERAQSCERLWSEIIELGWCGTLVPEGFDGAGGSLVDLAAIIEGCGRFAAPLPIVAAFAIAPLLVSALEGDHAKSLLRDIASAKVVVMPLLPPRGTLENHALETKRGGKDIVQLDGRVLGAELVPNATHYLVACPAEIGHMLLWVPTTTSGIAGKSRIRMDGRPSVDLDFRAVSLGLESILSTGDPVSLAIEKVHDAAALLVSVEVVGAMGALLEQTIGYLSSRVQFNVTLSSFQVLRHYVADMYVAYENLRALVNHTLRLAVEMPNSSWNEVALLKLRLADVSRFVAHTAIQAHGGMGVTEELPATRLAKRILMSDFEYGTGDFHAQRLLKARADDQCASHA